METGTTQRPVSQTVSEEVIRSVADAKGIEPTELPPLYDTLDPDALDSVFAASSVVRGKVIFEYEGFLVTVTDDDQVVVEESDDSDTR